MITRVAVLLFALTAPALANDGLQLQTACEQALAGLRYNDKDQIAATGTDAGFCLGYIVAIQDFADQKLCLPQPTSNVVVLMRIITGYGHAHPEALGKPMGVFAAEALTAAYPCP